jgi:hypothetical protein
MNFDQLAHKAWEEVGDGRPFHELPTEFQFRLHETAKEVIKGGKAEIAGLEEFEAKAVELYKVAVEEERAADEKARAEAAKTARAEIAARAEPVTEKRVAERRIAAQPISHPDRRSAAADRRAEATVI